MEAVHEVSLMEMLDAREQRVLRQQALSEQYHCPMICFTMNIAGPIKNDALIFRGFQYGKERLRRALLREGLVPVHEEESVSPAGCEAYCLVDADPLRIKKMTAAIEDQDPMGRLFDLDVLYEEKPTAVESTDDGDNAPLLLHVEGGNGFSRDSTKMRNPAAVHMVKVDRQEIGLPGRRCLICGGPAKVCARSRAHTVAALQERTHEILRETLDDADCEFIAQQACRALLYEVCTTPKPGLVDRRNTGSHRDMDLFTFVSSASTLQPYFRACVRIGLASARANETAADAFPRLRDAGKRAEEDMLAITNGVNTHKGAIFSMGILCAALGRVSPQERKEPDLVLAECAAMTEGLVERDYAGSAACGSMTAGQQQYFEYGVTGVRGQAQAGFPAVLQAGLPTLEKGLAQGLTKDQAGTAAMLAILAAMDDTNMIKRGGRREQLRRREEAAALLAKKPYPSEETLQALDDDYIRKNLSPGGSADLLALCWMLVFMRGL